MRYRQSIHHNNIKNTKIKEIKKKTKRQKTNAKTQHPKITTNQKKDGYGGNGVTAGQSLRHELQKL